MGEGYKNFNSQLLWPKIVNILFNLLKASVKKMSPNRNILSGAEPITDPESDRHARGPEQPTLPGITRKSTQFDGNRSEKEELYRSRDVHSEDSVETA